VKTNAVFIATSLDGYISDKNGDINWLHSIPIPEGSDMGYSAFMESVDALVMGRTTFETVCGFDIDWPYNKPVFVLSNSLSEIPEKFQSHAELVKGDLRAVVNQIHQQGYHKLYIDGGRTIQGFLKEDLIDEMIITTIPVILGGGSRLFGEQDQSLDFECVKSEVFFEKISQNHFKRVR
jgi:dihydrofolate reductase